LKTVEKEMPTVLQTASLSIHPGWVLLHPTIPARLAATEVVVALLDQYQVVLCSVGN
jgi:hypothetical protein